MKANDVLSVIGARVGDGLGIEGVACDSRKVGEGFLFACIKGAAEDGHGYAAMAVESGASVILAEEGSEVGPSRDGRPAGGSIHAGGREAAVVWVPDTKKALAACSAAFYGNPSRRFKLIGITGTKGKTTTAFVIREILERAGVRTGMLGSILYHDGASEYRPAINTPQSCDLQRYFSLMAANGVGACVMEVTSQGLRLSRADCSDFDIGIFTNIHSDHIGPNEHPDYEDYLASKKRLFGMCRTGILNMDSPDYERIAGGASCEAYTYSALGEADFRVRDVFLRGSGASFTME
ncbi:MAG: Mur ligase family protein, partial [Oscillospiraceae bacterium]|nr:Mur ligase family protein [Oscillospiraceae bacterium]